MITVPGISLGDGEVARDQLALIADVAVSTGPRAAVSGADQG